MRAHGPQAVREVAEALEVERLDVAEALRLELAEPVGDAAAVGVAPRERLGFEQTAERLGEVREQERLVLRREVALRELGREEVLLHGRELAALGDEQLD